MTTTVNPPDDLKKLLELHTEITAETNNYKLIPLFANMNIIQSAAILRRITSLDHLSTTGLVKNPSLFFIFLGIRSDTREDSTLNRLETYVLNLFNPTVRYGPNIYFSVIHFMNQINFSLYDIEEFKKIERYLLGIAQTDNIHRLTRLGKVVAFNLLEIITGFYKNNQDLKKRVMFDISVLREMRKKINRKEIENCIEEARKTNETKFGDKNISIIDVADSNLYGSLRTSIDLAGSLGEYLFDTLSKNTYFMRVNETANSSLIPIFSKGNTNSNNFYYEVSSRLDRYEEVTREDMSLCIKGDVMQFIKKEILTSGENAKLKETNTNIILGILSNMIVFLTRSARPMDRIVLNFMRKLLKAVSSDNQMDNISMNEHFVFPFTKEDMAKDYDLYHIALLTFMSCVSERQWTSEEFIKKIGKTFSEFYKRWIPAEVEGRTIQEINGSDGCDPLSRSLCFRIRYQKGMFDEIRSGSGSGDSETSLREEWREGINTYSKILNNNINSIRNNMTTLKDSAELMRYAVSLVTICHKIDAFYFWFHYFDPKNLIMKNELKGYQDYAVELYKSIEKKGVLKDKNNTVKYFEILRKMKQVYDYYERTIGLTMDVMDKEEKFLNMYKAINAYCEVISNDDVSHVPFYYLFMLHNRLWNTKTIIPNLTKTKITGGTQNINIPKHNTPNTTPTSQQSKPNPFTTIPQTPIPQQTQTYQQTQTFQQQTPQQIPQTQIPKPQTQQTQQTQTPQSTPQQQNPTVTPNKSGFNTGSSTSTTVNIPVSVTQNKENPKGGTTSETMKTNPVDIKEGEEIDIEDIDIDEEGEGKEEFFEPFDTSTPIPTEQDTTKKSLFENLLDTKPTPIPTPTTTPTPTPITTQKPTNILPPIQKPTQTPKSVTEEPKTGVGGESKTWDMAEFEFLQRGTISPEAKKFALLGLISAYVEGNIKYKTNIVHFTRELGVELARSINQRDRDLLINYYKAMDENSFKLDTNLQTIYNRLNEKKFIGLTGMKESIVHLGVVMDECVLIRLVIDMEGFKTKTHVEKCLYWIATLYRYSTEKISITNILVLSYMEIYEVKKKLKEKSWKIIPNDVRVVFAQPQEYILAKQEQDKSMATTDNDRRNEMVKYRKLLYESFEINAKLKEKYPNFRTDPSNMDQNDIDGAVELTKKLDENENDMTETFTKSVEKRFNVPLFAADIARPVELKKSYDKFVNSIIHAQSQQGNNSGRFQSGFGSQVLRNSSASSSAKPDEKSREYTDASRDIGAIMNCLTLLGDSLSKENWDRVIRAKGLTDEQYSAIAGLFNSETEKGRENARTMEIIRLFLRMVVIYLCRSHFLKKFEINLTKELQNISESNKKAMSTLDVVIVGKDQTTGPEMLFDTTTAIDGFVGESMSRLFGQVFQNGMMIYNPQIVSMSYNLDYVSLFMRFLAYRLLLSGFYAVIRKLLTEAKFFSIVQPQDPSLISGEDARPDFKTLNLSELVWTKKDVIGDYTKTNEWLAVNLSQILKQIDSSIKTEVVATDLPKNGETYRRFKNRTNNMQRNVKDYRFKMFSFCLSGACGKFIDLFKDEIIKQMKIKMSEMTTSGKTLERQTAQEHLDYLEKHEKELSFSGELVWSSLDESSVMAINSAYHDIGDNIMSIIFNSSNYLPKEYKSKTHMSYLEDFYSKYAEDDNFTKTDKGFLAFKKHVMEYNYDTIVNNKTRGTIFYVIYHFLTTKIVEKLQEDWMKERYPFGAISMFIDAFHTSRIAINEPDTISFVEVTEMWKRLLVVIKKNRNKVYDKALSQAIPDMSSGSDEKGRGEKPQGVKISFNDMANESLLVYKNSGDNLKSLDVVHYIRAISLWGNMNGNLQTIARSDFESDMRQYVSDEVLMTASILSSITDERVVVMMIILLEKLSYESFVDRVWSLLTEQERRSGLDSTRMRIKIFCNSILETMVRILRRFPDVVPKTIDSMKTYGEVNLTDCLLRLFEKWITAIVMGGEDAVSDYSILKESLGNVKNTKENNNNASSIITEDYVKNKTETILSQTTSKGDKSKIHKRDANVTYMQKMGLVFSARTHILYPSNNMSMFFYFVNRMLLEAALGKNQISFGTTMLIPQDVSLEDGIENKRDGVPYFDKKEKTKLKRLFDNLSAQAILIEKYMDKIVYQTTFASKIFQWLSKWARKMTKKWTGKKPVSFSRSRGSKKAKEMSGGFDSTESKDLYRRYMDTMREIDNIAKYAPRWRKMSVANMKDFINGFLNIEGKSGSKYKNDVFFDNMSAIASIMTVTTTSGSTNNKPLMDALEEEVKSMRLSEAASSDKKNRRFYFGAPPGKYEFNFYIAYVFSVFLDPNSNTQFNKKNVWENFYSDDTMTVIRARYMTELCRFFHVKSTPNDASLYRDPLYKTDDMKKMIEENLAKDPVLRDSISKSLEKDQMETTSQFVELKTSDRSNRVRNQNNDKKYRNRDNKSR